MMTTLAAPPVNTVWQRTYIPGDATFRVASPPDFWGYIKLVDLHTGSHHWAKLDRFGIRYRLLDEFSRLIGTIRQDWGTVATPTPTRKPRARRGARNA